MVGRQPRTSGSTPSASRTAIPRRWRSGQRALNRSAALPGSTADRPRTPPSEWAGGERYGDENDDYYAEYRGQVRGASPGDDVEVWFGGRVGWAQGLVQSEHFTYTVDSDTGNDVLVIANEDYTGVDPGIHPA